MKSPHLNTRFPYIEIKGKHYSGYPVMWIFLVFILQSGLSSFNLAGSLNIAPAFDKLAVHAPADDWVLHSTVRNVDLYYRISDCSGKKVVFLKFNNRNTIAVRLSWKEVFTTQFDVRKEGIKGTKQLLLPAGETGQSDCSNITIRECVVLPQHVSPAYLAEIKQFGFTNITVGNQ